VKLRDMLLTQEGRQETNKKRNSKALSKIGLLLALYCHRRIYALNEKLTINTL